MVPRIRREGSWLRPLFLSHHSELELKSVTGPHDIVCIHGAYSGNENKAIPGIRNQVDLLAFKGFFH